MKARPSPAAAAAAMFEMLRHVRLPRRNRTEEVASLRLAVGARARVRPAKGVPEGKLMARSDPTLPRHHKGEETIIDRKSQKISHHIPALHCMYLPRCQPAATSARPDEHATGLLSPCWAPSIATLARPSFAIQSLRFSGIHSPLIIREQIIRIHLRILLCRVEFKYANPIESSHY